MIVSANAAFDAIFRNGLLKWKIFYMHGIHAGFRYLDMSL